MTYSFSIAYGRLYPGGSFLVLRATEPAGPAFSVFREAPVQLIFNYLSPPLSPIFGVCLYLEVSLNSPIN